MGLGQRAQGSGANRRGLFDDPVLDKGYSHRIELVRRQWSGNAQAVIKGIGVVTCVYANPELDQFWLIDDRLYGPDGDGKSKLDHVRDMRWRIEQLHREGKQVTGLERCQCRTARLQRNHIGCAFLVWVRLQHWAAQTGCTVYQRKHGLLDDYLTHQLRNPSLEMVLA